jgi:tRNA A-37 threonylcarbamoyl transferase component Bud32
MECVDYGACTILDERAFIMVFPTYLHSAIDIERLSIRAVQYVGSRILTIIDGIHKSGYVHGDLTLSKFMVSRKREYLV